MTEKWNWGTPALISWASLITAFMDLPDRKDFIIEKTLPEMQSLESSNTYTMNCRISFKLCTSDRSRNKFTMMRLCWESMKESFIKQLFSSDDGVKDAVCTRPREQPRILERCPRSRVEYDELKTIWRTLFKTCDIAVSFRMLWAISLLDWL